MAIPWQPFSLHIPCSSETAAADLTPTAHLDVQLGELRLSELRAIGAWPHKGDGDADLGCKTMHTHTSIYILYIYIYNQIM